MVPSITGSRPGPEHPGLGKAAPHHHTTTTMFSAGKRFLGFFQMKHYINFLPGVTELRPSKKCNIHLVSRQNLILLRGSFLRRFTTVRHFLHLWITALAKP